MYSEKLLAVQFTHLSYLLKLYLVSSSFDGPKTG